MTTAHADLTTNIAVSSDYIFRGISNSNRQPALQGGIDYAHAAGWYAGGWASNVDFRDGGEATLEVDGYVGHAGSTGKLAWNAGWTAFVYPGAGKSLQYDARRISLGAQYDLAVAAPGIYFDRIDNVFGSGPGYYLESSLMVPLPENLSLDVRLGRQRYSDNVYLALPDFTWRSLALIWQSAPWETRLTLQDNGVAQADCFSGKTWCGPALTLQVTRRFNLAEGLI